MTAVRVVLLVVALSLVASATPTFTVLGLGPGLTATLLVPPAAPTAWDVRGLEAIAVLDPALLGVVFVLDPLVGTDPLFATLPFGNFGNFGAIPSLAQVINVFFDPMPFATTATSASFFASVSPLFPAVITDAALSRISSSVAWNFTLFNTFTDANSNTFFQYKLTSLEILQNVPEPSSFVLMGIALLGTGFVARRRQVR